MSAAVQGIINHGSGGTVVDIECGLSNNLPNIIIVGFANKAVGESKERIRGAFAYSRIMLPRKRITVNLAPADIPKEDSGFDLAIAVAILLASQQIRLAPTKQQAYIGELGLDGSTRAVRGIIGKIMLGRAKGITTFFIPEANLAQARLVPNILLMPVASLRQLYEHLNGDITIKLTMTGVGSYQAPTDQQSLPISLSPISGQEQAKRALQIAAAGGHNVFFSGPPGTGKSMLARALQGLLPPLSREEALEVTHLHSLAGDAFDEIITARPFRAPHHSASEVAVIGGGGSQLRPGEISLAHRGVLFLDEMLEFGQSTLEALRQPLEDRRIHIARARDTAEYPANFILIATANPCPCGFYGTQSGTCRCTGAARAAYDRKLSGPILDRIELYADVHQVEHKKLLKSTPNAASDTLAKTAIKRARVLQAKRYGNNSQLNADMTNGEVRALSAMTQSALKILNDAGPRLKLSARGYMRTIKVARTLADLDGAKEVVGDHITEALSYRRPIVDS